MAVTPETRVVAAPGNLGEASASGVAWPPIIGGAFASAAISILLLALGSGIGLASVSPWPSSNPSPTAFTAMAAIWLIIVQWISSGLGGYLTGRMRPSGWKSTRTKCSFGIPPTDFLPGPSRPSSSSVLSPLLPHRSLAERLEQRRPLPAELSAAQLRAQRKMPRPQVKPITS